MEVLQVQDVQEKLQKYLWITWDTPEGEPRGIRFPLRTVKTTRPFDVLAEGPKFKVVRFWSRGLAPPKLVLYQPATTEEIQKAVDAFIQHEGGRLRDWWVDV